MTHPEAPEGFLENISFTVHEKDAPIFEKALQTVCLTVSIFEVDEKNLTWRVEGIKIPHERQEELDSALELASFLTGCTPDILIEYVPQKGWLEKVAQEFPPLLAGEKFCINGSHLLPEKPDHPERLNLYLDAGIAFGSGQHETTRGCIKALEEIAKTYPEKFPGSILDMGCGSGILAMAAAKLWNQPVLGIDIEEDAVRVTKENAERNNISSLISAYQADGWQAGHAQKNAPYGLIFANILAGPLCEMAEDLTNALDNKGYAILAGLLAVQADEVLEAYQKTGLSLEKRFDDNGWTILLLRK
ncbi:50S ribosomal protein L11 methyltransferase [Acetobacteraceae bacterium]|nr:50S ribosomal protein L11 methyltransferase [Acetobacteraceae bacterium]